MNWRRVLMIAVVVGACSDGSGPPVDDVDDPVAATITVDNGAGTAIDRVYFTACDIADWGVNRLEPGELIAVAATRSWTVDAGCWDLRTETSTGVARQFFDVTIDAGQTRVFRIT
jgi:hypothetical protein